ncbi:NAD-dependent glycerol dehydrogenase [Roseobacter fucihabitans]|uniref:NAD-dependent glycerol dehydrogenase n=1 Tax=Roseobacter fucihabitans TaxID=1537242 RepID=A0ABZ2BWU1_9RHOB|nr:SDR family oxidoreductase [Roseobacter litoralis]MBC6966083.1 Gluconate 5-dehydrogenase [Roseobacter litoralis]
MTWQDRFSIAGKVALVTGASSGIGAEIVRVFTQAGATVIATGRCEHRLNTLAQQTACTTIAADIATVEGCESVITQALAGQEQVDILVNSAGVALVGPVLEFDPADWDRTMAINLRAPFLLAKGVAPGMIAAGGGKIINISSQTGVIALPDHAAYAASKGGLNALTKSLMAELAPHNIQVNAICPTVVLTEMGRQIWSPPEKSGPMIAATPLGRFGEPVEIADMALYLAAPASDLVNGALMMIEGGFSSV